MLTQNKNTLLIKVFLTILRLIINYIAYIFLTGSVIFAITILLFIILNLNPDVSFGFVQYFAFLNPAYSTGSFHMGIKDIMQIFLVCSLILLLIVKIARFILKRYFNFEKNFTLKLKIISTLATITLAYILASIIVAVGNLDSGFYIVFIIFYLINLFCAVFYILFDWISEKIAKFNNRSVKV